MKRYSLSEIQSMETIFQGHVSNLKYDDGNTRVWLSRLTIEDGMPYNNQVVVEKLIKGNWKTTSEYEAKSKKVYQRTTRDCWRFYCNYGQGWEHEITEYTKEKMKENKKAYQQNSPYPLKVVKGRERIQKEVNSNEK